LHCGEQNGNAAFSAGGWIGLPQMGHLGLERASMRLT
jgi:hypothetical protein